jgi:hypothetical protein
MWMLSFLPDGLLHFVILCVLFGGVGLYVAGLFMNFLPWLKPYKEPVRILSTFLCVAGVYFYGSYATEIEWRAKVEALQAKLEVAETKSQEVVTVIKEKIVWKTKVIHDTQIVVQEKIVHDAAVIDAQCKVPQIAIDDLNAAARDPAQENKGDKK